MRNEPVVKVHAILATDHERAAKECIVMMPLSWERYGSFMPADLSVTWVAERTFVDWARQLAVQPAAGDDGGLPSGSDVAAIRPEAATDLQFTLNWQKGPPAPHALKQVEVSLRFLYPHFSADYRPPVERLAEQFQAMADRFGKPDRRIVIGVTDMSIEHAPQAGLGTGIDQLLNPMTLPTLVEHLGGETPAPNIAVALTGLERIFCDFIDLARRRVDHPIGRLPWHAHSNAFAAARDPKIMIPLLHIVLDERRHLLNVVHNHILLREGGFGISLLAVMPCGFLSTGSGVPVVNYDPLSKHWLFGDPSSMAMRDEADAPFVVPYACCDALLSPLLEIATPMQIRPDGLVGGRHSRLGRIAHTIGRNRRVA